MPTVSTDDVLSSVKAKMLVFVDQNDWVNCLATLQELATHPSLRDHYAIAESQRLLAAGRLRTKAELRSFVEAM